MRRLSVILLAVVLGAVLTGCSSAEDVMSELGVSGEVPYELQALEKERGLAGSTGSFFRSGSFAEETSLLFAIELDDGRTIVLEMPYSQLEFIQDESVTTPTVQFTWGRTSPRQNANFYSNYGLSQVMAWEVGKATIRLTPGLFDEQVGPLIKIGS